jgi:hypothetical protein
MPPGGDPDGSPIVDKGVLLALNTPGFADRARRVVKTRRVQVWHPDLTLLGTGQSEDPFFFGALGAFVSEIHPLFTPAPPVTRGKLDVGGERAGLIGDPMALMTTARRAIPRGSTDAVQHDLLAKDGASALHIRALHHLHRRMAETRRAVEPRPYGFVRESSSGPFHFIHGASKRVLHDLILEHVELLKKALVALYAGDHPVASRHVTELAIAGLCFSSADGERMQLNRVKGDDPFDLEPGKQRFGVSWDQDEQELDQRVSLSYIPEGGGEADSRMAYAVTAKPRLIHMKGIGANGPFQVLHRDTWDEATHLIKSGISPSLTGLEEGGEHFRVDVRACDKRLPWGFAVEALRSRVRTLGEAPISAGINALMMTAPAFVFSDVLGVRGAGSLGRYGDTRTWTCFPGNPSGIGDNTDKNVEGTQSDWAVRLATDGIVSTPEAGVDLLWEALTHRDMRTTLNQRGDGFHFRSGDTGLTRRIRESILRPAKPGEIYDYESADAEAYDGHHLTSQGWIRDVVSLLGKVLRPERSVWTPREETRPRCPGQGLQLRLSMIRSVPGGDEVLSALDKHFSAIIGPIDEYASALRKRDAIPTELTEIDLAVLNNPSAVGQYDERDISPDVLEAVKSLYTVKEVAAFKSRLSVDMPLPPDTWR